MLPNGLETELKHLPKEWHITQSVIEMRKAGSTQWRQSEWTGFYFQFLCEKYLGAIFRMPGARYGNVEFDAEIEGKNCDFKAHTANERNGSKKKLAILNDVEAMNLSMNKNKVHHLLMVNLFCTFDDNGVLKKWHQEQKGAPSRYVLEGRMNNRRQRRLKAGATVLEYKWISFNPGDYSNLKIMYQGRNADGSPRKPKYMLDTSNLQTLNHHTIKV